ncbi:MAG: copper resistance protein B [Gammaproteobacteria bacterium]
MQTICTALLWIKVTNLLAAEPSATPHADRVLAYLQAEQSELRVTDEDSETYSWDVRGWIGGDYDRLWFKTQGDHLLDGPVETAELQLRYSRLVTAFWELAVGVRYDLEPEPSRGFAVFAAHGLAPYLYEVDADAFISEDGDVSARLEVEYPILITQRLILQPALELDFAVQEVEEIGIGPGLSQVELGLRLRYEIVREFAPYVGFVWERKVGRTADLARRRGEDIDIPAFVAGVRFWY